MKNIKGLKRTLLGVGSLVLLLIVLLTATFLFWLGPTVKILAEKIGSKALGAPISMENLSINPRKGTLLLTGFEIGNHDNFNYTNTVSLAEVRITLDMETLFSDTIVVEEILIDSPFFVYEQNRVTDNITEYITNIFAFAKIDPNQPKPSKKKKKKDPEKEPKQLVVNRLRITDVKMFLANTDDHDLDLHVGVEDIGLSMSNGFIQIKNLTISDPGPLTTPNIFVLNSVDIQIDPDSIYSDRIIIEKVHLHKPYAFYEQNSKTDTVAEFIKIVDSFGSKSTQKPVLPDTVIEASEPESIPKKPVPTVELRELVIDDIQLHVVNIAKPELNIRLRLEQLTLSPVFGDVQLHHLTLSHPKRLATPNVFELDAIKIKFDPTSLTNSTVVINDVQVIKPYAFLEQNSETDTVTEFMRIAKRIAADRSKDNSTKKPKIAKPKKTITSKSAPPPIELHNLLVDDIQLKLLDTAHTNVPDGLQTMASIGSISVKLVKGTLRIDAITIPNPASGFTTANLFHLPSIDITIDPKSIFSEQLIIQEVHIDSPLINLEQTETTGNVTELQKITEGFTPPVSKTVTVPEPTQRPEAGATHAPVPLAEQPVVLHALIITNLAVNMTTPTPTNKPSMSMDRLRPKNLLALNSETNAPPGEDFLTLAAFERLLVEPLKGLIHIAKLQVGNPEGFANPDLVTIEQLNVRIDPDSIPTDTLLIEDILIEQPRIAYERQLTTDNIKALQAFIESTIQKREESLSEGPGDEGASTTNAPIAITDASVTNELNATASTSSNAPAGQKVIISHLLVKDGMVRAKLSALPTAPIPLPNIEMVDIGKEEGGASFGETTSKLYESFYDAIIGSVSSVTGFAGDLLKGAGALTLGSLGTNSTDVSASDTDELNEPDMTEEKKKPRRPFGGRRSPGRAF